MSSATPAVIRPPFPDGFAWGCATSPTQVEGETMNEWESFVARDGTSPDDGPNHWRRYRYDFKSLRDLGCNAYRLGFDWGRLQREPWGELHRDTRLRYLEMLAELRSLGIEPFLTLFHFACPKWLAEKGGWLHPQAPMLFADFADRLAQLTDGEVRHWITLNEPDVYALLAYVQAEFPPRRSGRIDLAFQALARLRRGHALAAARIRARQPAAKIGVTKHCKRFLPARAAHPGDRLMAWGARAFFERWVLSRFLRVPGAPACDFVGVNYYGRLRFRGLQAVSPLTGTSADEVRRRYGAECDDMWEQDPGGLADCLRETARRTGLPVYVTEIGSATADEELRSRLLKGHLEACREALAAGVDLRGIFYWSLLDNYEWSEGLAKRFGLLSVNFVDPARRRSPRPAARLFAAAARGNGP